MNLSDFTTSSLLKLLPGGIDNIIGFQQQVGKLDNSIREVQSYLNRLSLYIQSEEFEKLVE